jgi:hypothetical protein
LGGNPQLIEIYQLGLPKKINPTLMRNKAVDDINGLDE